MPKSKNRQPSGPQQRGACAAGLRQVEVAHQRPTRFHIQRPAVVVDGAVKQIGTGVEMWRVDIERGADVDGDDGGLGGTVEVVGVDADERVGKDRGVSVLANDSTAQNLPALERRAVDKIDRPRWLRFDNAARFRDSRIWTLPAPLA